MNWLIGIVVAVRLGWPWLVGMAAVLFGVVGLSVLL